MSALENAEETTGRRILAIFAKQPRLGFVKTRLASETSPAWAAEIAEAFLLDLVDRFADVGDERILVYSPADAESWFRHAAGSRYRVIPQSGGELGERLASFIHEQMRSKDDRIVVLGADSPTVPSAFVEQAFDELKIADVVFGPAMDGGYYLLGCARELPPIFDGIAWSGPTVLAETIARLLDRAYRVALLPPWYDVDRLDDWHMLRGHVLAMRRAGMDPGAPRTERLVSCAPP
jgi:rSAM/selenodomain-associated transferase 1